MAIELLGAGGATSVEPVADPMLADPTHESGPSSRTGGPGRDRAWIRAADLERATGWKLAPEGLCSGELCTPLREDVLERCTHGDAVDVVGLWRALGRPVLADAEAQTFALGESAGDRGARIEAGEAPDFALPDLDERVHRLSDFRGKKVLLVTWASW